MKNLERNKVIVNFIEGCKRQAKEVDSTAPPAPANNARPFQSTSYLSPKSLEQASSSALDGCAGGVEIEGYLRRGGHVGRGS